MLDPRHWNSTAEERAADYPCAGRLPKPYRSFFRAIDVDAPPQVVFRWLCQLKVAPYSYDWLDNRGRPSPRELTPGVQELAVGQHFLIFELVDFEPDVHLTGVARPEAQRLYGPIAVTYQVNPRGTTWSRLIGRLDVAASSLPARVRRSALAVGDVLMMRKQFLNLKELSERDAVGA
jgi:hypothetical protein